MREILTNKGLSPMARLVYAVIAEGVAPSPSVLAKEIGLSRVTVYKCLNELGIVPCSKYEQPVQNMNNSVQNMNNSENKFSDAYNVLRSTLKDNINTKQQDVPKELSTADVVITPKKVTYEDLKDYVFRNNINIISSHIVGFEEKNSTAPVAKKEKKIKDTTELTYRVVTYLNDKLNGSYKATSALTKELVSARAGEGFCYEDFVAVIDTMSQEWLYDEKMRKYLRPETLFSRKFEGYLNRARLPTPRVRGSPKTQGNWALLEDRIRRGVYDEEEEEEF